MKIARVFLNPNAEQWVDFQCPETAQLNQIWSQVMAEGMFYNQNAVVPKVAIHHVLMLEIQDSGTNLTVFPGGKPN